jgi:hypothetical protein
LLPEDLFEDFAREYHCPTAFHAKHLDYKDKKGKQVVVILLGNPTCIGPNINSADKFTSEQSSSSKYETIRFKASEGCKGEMKNGKQQIYDDCIHLPVSLATYNSIVKHRSEIVTRYEKTSDGQDFYKAFSEDKTYCDICFKLTSKRTNPIVCCGMKHCNAGRHRLCFKNEPGIKDILQLSHYCSDHGAALMQNVMPSDAPSSSSQSSSRRKHTPENNHPPPWSPTTISPSEQQYLHPDDRVGLYFNCRELQVEVRTSKLPSAGHGLFAETGFKEGATIGYFFGKIKSKQEFDAMISDPEIRIDKFEKDYMEDWRKGVERCLDVSDSIQDETDEYRMLVSRQCPMGYINDPSCQTGRDASSNIHRVSEANCFITFPREITVTEDGHLPWNSFRVVAKKQIGVGEELYFDYGWEKKIWKESLRKRKSQYTSPGPTEKSSEGLGGIPTPIEQRYNNFKAKDLSGNHLPASKDDSAHNVQSSNLQIEGGVQHLTRRRQNSLLINHLQEKEGSSEELKETSLSEAHASYHNQDDAHSDEISEALLQDYSYEITCTPRRGKRRNPCAPDSSRLKNMAASHQVEEEQPGCIMDAEASEEPNNNDDAMSDEEASDEDYEDDDASPSEEDEVDIDDDGSDYDHEAEDVHVSGQIPEEEHPSDERGEIQASSMIVAEQVEERALRAENLQPEIEKKKLCPHSTTITMSVRKSAQTRELLHYKYSTWSSAEMADFMNVINEYIVNNEKKFKKTIAADLVNDKKRDRILKFSKFADDWAEISACCGRIRTLPPTHPLKDAIQLLKRRVDILGQRGKSDDENTRQCLLDYIRNLTVDPDDPKCQEKCSKIVTFDGHRCCVSCFRAAMGVARSTMYDIRTKLFNGEFVAIDVRKKRNGGSGNRVPYRLTLAVNALQRMLPFADTLPTNEGGQKNQFYQFPQTQMTQLYEAVRDKINPSKEAAQNVSDSTIRDAISYLKNIHSVTISVRQNKKFMQCTTCFNLSNLSGSAEAKQQERMAAKEKRKVHLRQVNMQRKDFERLRDMAM